MSNNSFRFKQFAIHQEQTAMKVGTDAVLLGAWAKVAGAKNCLDIGTGTGILALMIAQRNPDIVIHAIDSIEAAVVQAFENVEKSPWPDRIKVENISVQDYINSCHKRYEILICNPPFFKKGFPVLDVQRNKARVAENLSDQDLILAAKKLLSGNGLLAIVMPVFEGEQFIQSALLQGLYCVRKTTVFTRKSKPSLRLLLEFAQEEKIITADEIVIYENDSNNYTSAYKKITSAFYMKF